ncbi:MAG: sortase domain-bontaining protein [Colwellia sp.]
MITIQQSIKLKNILTGLLVLTALISFSYVGYMKCKALLAQYLLETAWGETQQNAKDSLTIKAVKPWLWADVYPVAKLGFAKQDRHFIVLNNDSGQALAFAPGINPSTPIEGKLPIVISAHNDSHFSLLENVKIADEISLETRNGEVTTFEVISIKTIDIRKDKLFVEDNSDYNDESFTSGTSSSDVPIQGLILVTCYPFNAISRETPYRYLIEAVLL